MLLSGKLCETEDFQNCYLVTSEHHFLRCLLFLEGLKLHQFQQHEVSSSRLSVNDKSRNNTHSS